MLKIIGYASFLLADRVLSPSAFSGLFAISLSALSGPPGGVICCHFFCLVKNIKYRSRKINGCFAAGGKRLAKLLMIIPEMFGKQRKEGKKKLLLPCFCERI